MPMTRLTFALDQIAFARRYLNSRADLFDADEWFVIPPGTTTHLAWQVGHLTVAEYRLGLERIRGRQSDDNRLIPDEALTLFGAGSVAHPDPARYPAIADLRATLNRVHDAVLTLSATLTEADLDAQPLKPHPLFNTKYGSLCWMSHHEMLHIGQIGMIRRMLGHAPVW
jgi:hypothetical protein